MAGFKTLDQIGDIQGKRVLVRVDLNVPTADGKVTDTTRIERVKPTITELSDKGAKVVLLAHFGRPKGGPDPEFTLAPVAVSPDELEGVWTADGRLQVSIRCRPAEGPDRVTGREYPQGCFEVINALGEASRAGPQPPGVWCLGAQAPVVPVRPARYRLEIVDARGGNLCGRIPGVRTSPS